MRRRWPHEDLFSGAAEERLSSRAPLAARLRPRTLDEIVGQQHLVGPGAPLRALVEADRLTSAILWGPPGTGKTTLASVIAGATAKHFVPLSAVTAGVKDVREVVETAPADCSASRGGGPSSSSTRCTVSTRPSRTRCSLRSRTASSSSSAPPPRTPSSRSTPPCCRGRRCGASSHSLPTSSRRWCARGLAAEGAEAEPEAVDALVGLADGDARAVLTTLEVALALAGAQPVTARTWSGPGPPASIRYGESEHYDQVSAFIKSIRGSDPDAGLYWLARMLEAGEDARFIARRLVILASEDVGEADPLALVVADAAARAVEFVGLPEAQLNLAQAVVHLACAPKSNRVTVALGRARDDVRSGPPGEVPAHLRDAHYRSASGHRPRRGLRLPPRHPGGLGRPGVPSRGGGRPPLLRAERPGARGGGGRTPDAGSRSGDRAMPRERGVDVTGRAGAVVVRLALAGAAPVAAWRWPDRSLRAGRRGWCSSWRAPRREHGHRCRPAPAGARAGRLSDDVVTADIVLRPRDAAALAPLASAVSTPGSAVDRHYLTPRQFRPGLRLRARGRSRRAFVADLVRPLGGGDVGQRDARSRHRDGRPARAGLAVPLVRARLPGGRVARATTADPLVPGRPRSGGGRGGRAVDGGRGPSAARAGTVGRPAPCGCRQSIRET